MYVCAKRFTLRRSCACSSVSKRYVMDGHASVWSCECARQKAGKTSMKAGMKAGMKAVLLFDIDGTLVSTGGAGRRAMVGAFASLYGKPDVFEGTSFAGM